MVAASFSHPTVPWPMADMRRTMVKRRDTAPAMVAANVAKHDCSPRVAARGPTRQTPKRGLSERLKPANMRRRKS